MSFRKKPFCFSSSAGVDIPPETQKVVDGNVTFVREKPAKVSPEVQSLENLIKAGVPLKEVKSVVFSDVDGETVASEIQKLNDKLESETPKDE